MPRWSLVDLLQQYPEAHLVSAVLLPMRREEHVHRLRGMIDQLIEQQAKTPSATAITREEGVLEILCGFGDESNADTPARLTEARAAQPRSGWSNHRSFRLSANKEVTLAGLLAPPRASP
jgi:hypothetical protein